MIWKLWLFHNKRKKHCSIKSYEKRFENANKDQQKQLHQYKIFSCEKNTIVKVTSKILNQKMLTFAKIFLASFIYYMIDGFSFLVNTARNLYSQNEMIKCQLYLLFTDTNNTTLQLVLIYQLNCVIREATSFRNNSRVWD